MFHQIKSRESLLHCWRCEATIQSSDQVGVFFDDCQAQFDFTQHTREDCNGKCWKSVDLINTRLFENNTDERLLLEGTDRKQFKSSRRCFSVDELVRAAEMGVNTSDGCRQVKRDDRKIKEICFCSDQDMCNSQFELTNNYFMLLSFIFLVYVNKLYGYCEV